MDDMLRTAWQEDRSEIRGIKDRMSNVCSFLTAGSFAITSFLLGKDCPRVAEWVGMLVDPTFITMLWMLFLFLKRDLTIAHKCKDMREDLIRDLLNECPKICRDPFPVVPDGQPKIRENDLYVLPIVATIAMLGKLFLMVGFSPAT